MTFNKIYIFVYYKSFKFRLSFEFIFRYNGFSEANARNYDILLNISVKEGFLIGLRYASVTLTLHKSDNYLAVSLFN